MIDRLVWLSRLRVLPPLTGQAVDLLLALRAGGHDDQDVRQDGPGRMPRS